MARTVVGLDIGTAGIRVVEAKVSPKKGLTVLRHGTIALPPGAVEGGVVVKPDIVTAALRQLWEQVKVSSAEVRIGIGSGSVLVRQLDLDWMPEADLRKSLRYQVGDMLPVPVDDANLDHVFLGEHEVPGEDGSPQRKVRILLTATARDAVDSLVRCVQAAKLRPVVADLGALALIRAAATAPGAQADAEAILDIGVDKVTVAVHAAGRPLTIRVIPGIGGALFTRALVEQTGRDWLAAERAKCATITLPAPGTPPLDLDQAAMLAAAQRTLAEVRNTLDFHTSSDPANRPTRLLLAGAGGALAGLTGHCEAMLGMPAVRFDTTATGAQLPGTATAGEQGQATDPVLAYGLCLEVTL